MFKLFDKQYVASINKSGYTELEAFLAYAIDGCRRFARHVEAAAR